MSCAAVEAVAAEIRNAEESERVLELLGRALADPARADQAEGDRERACIQTEGGPLVAASGLVSVPTTHTRHVGKPLLPFGVLADDAALMQLIGAFRPDAEARRLSQLRMHVGFAARGHCAEPLKGGDEIGRAHV